MSRLAPDVMRKLKRRMRPIAPRRASTIDPSCQRDQLNEPLVSYRITEKEMQMVMALRKARKAKRIRTACVDALLVLPLLEAVDAAFEIAIEIEDLAIAKGIVEPRSKVTP